MAVTVRTLLVDDYTLEELPDQGAQLILVVNGIKYELDLSQASLSEFRQAIDPFLRNVEGRRLSNELYREIVAATAPEQPRRVVNRAIRRWWERNYRERGLPEPSRHGKGRIPERVKQDYYRNIGRADTESNQPTTDS